MEANVTAGDPPDAKFVPVITADVEPTARLTEVVDVTVGMGRTVPTTPGSLATPYTEMTAVSVFPANDEDSAGIDNVICVVLDTTNALTVMEVPSEAERVAVGDPAAEYHVPVTTTLVLPTATFVDVVSDTVGTARTVPTMVAEPLDKPNIVTTALMEVPDVMDDWVVESTVMVVALLTVTLDVVHDVEVVENVTDALLPDLKLVPVITMDVEA